MKVLIFFSGGKDSQACLIHSVKKYGVENCEAVFCDTGWENPVTYQHIKTITTQMNVKLVTIKSSKYDGFVDMSVQRKMFPMTKARFCTEELKSKPAIDYVLSKTESVIVIEGIRKNESLSRSLMLDQCVYFKYYFEKSPNGKKHTYRKIDVFEWCKTFNADKVRPIFNWSATETINYIKDNGQDVNQLYYMGFSRVGCFPCIMSRHKEIKLIIDNHPEQWQAVKDAEKLVGSSFLKPDFAPKRFSTGRSINNKTFTTLEMPKNI